MPAVLIESQERHIKSFTCLHYVDKDVNYMDRLMYLTYSYADLDDFLRLTKSEYYLDIQIFGPKLTETIRETKSFDFYDKKINELIKNVVDGKELGEEFIIYLTFVRLDHPKHSMDVLVESEDKKFYAYRYCVQDNRISNASMPAKMITNLTKEEVYQLVPLQTNFDLYKSAINNIVKK